jgi:hypothetical protein
MIYIAHRGLFQGPDKEKENHPDQIRKALKKRYDCEVDVWWKSDGWWLGHDEPIVLLLVNKAFGFIVKILMHFMNCQLHHLNTLTFGIKKMILR